MNDFIFFAVTSSFRINAIRVLSQDENPLQILIKEELSHGTVIGAVEAVDLDAGENAKIGYVIIGNYLCHEITFALNRVIYAILLTRLKIAAKVGMGQ